MPWRRISRIRRRGIPLITTNPSRAIEAHSLPHLVVMRFANTEIANVNGEIVESPFPANPAERTSCLLTIWGTEKNVMNCLNAVIEKVMNLSAEDLLISIRSGGGDEDLMMRACRSAETSTENGQLLWISLAVSVTENGQLKYIVIHPCKLMKNETEDALVTQKYIYEIHGKEISDKDPYYLGNQEPYRSLARRDATLEISVRYFSPTMYVPLREANAEWIHCPAGDFQGYMSPDIGEFNAINIGCVHRMGARYGEADRTFSGTWIRTAVSDIIIRPLAATTRTPATPGTAK